MKGSYKATDALALLTTTQVEQATVNKFSDSVATEFALIPQQERMNAARAILVGIGLHAVKASLKHKQFTPWMEANLTQGKIWTKTTAIKNASFFMRLAIAFVDQAKPTRPEMLAITAAGSVSTDGANAEGMKKIMARIDKFIGDRSLNEMLVDEGIKTSGSSSGGSKAAIDVGGTSTGDDPLFADTASHLMGLRSLLLDPETVKRFTATQLDDIEKQLASGLDQFRQLRAQMSQG